MTAKEAFILLLQKLAQKTQTSPKHGGTVTAVSVGVQVAMMAIFVFIGYGIILTPLEWSGAAEMIGRDWIWFTIVIASLFAWGEIMWGTTWCKRWFFIVKPRYGSVGSWLIGNKISTGAKIPKPTRRMKQFSVGWHGAIPGVFELSTGINLNGTVFFGQKEGEPIEIFTAPADKNKKVLLGWNAVARPLEDFMCELACQPIEQSARFYENELSAVARDWCATANEASVFAGLASKGVLAKEMVNHYGPYDVADEEEQHRGLGVEDITVHTLGRDEVQQKLSEREQELDKTVTGIKKLLGAFPEKYQDRLNPNAVLFKAGGIMSDENGETIFALGEGSGNLNIGTAKAIGKTGNKKARS